MDDSTTGERGPRRRELTRRRALSLVATGALVGLAGCSGGSAAGENGDGGGDTETPRYDGYLDGASGYDGSVTDRTGSDEVSVTVGAGDGFGFDPAAIRVSPDTTVVWEWSGLGSRHNVVDEDGAFESPYYAAEGETFSHEFTEVGVTKYYCTPHRNLGMVGVVEVVDE